MISRRTALIPLLLITLLITAGSGSSARAGVVYTAKELLALGELWVETRCQWSTEKKIHDRRMDKIRGKKCSDMKKDLLFNREAGRHRNRSNTLAAKRDQVQNALIIESNARVKGGKQPSSGKMTDTAGTKFGQDGHRNMVGDRDMGAGARTTEKVKKVLQDMGLYDPKNPGRSKITFNENAATLEINDDFELVINKDGLRPKAGTEYHQVQVDVNARNPETYVSESMKTKKDGKVVKQQVGTEYVEGQDLRKKASTGLTSSGDDLVKNPGKMQTMSKGTYKALDMGRVDDATLGKILKQNGIKGGPAQFKKKLHSLYRGTGRAVTDPKQAERIRRAAEDIFSIAERATFRQAKIDIADLRAKAASLPANDPVRLKMEDEIVDSVTKMKRTKAINDEFMSRALAKRRPGMLPDAPTPRAKITPNNIDLELKHIEAPPGGMAKQRALKSFGVTMTIVDIGQACQALEDYLSGKKSFSDTAIHFADMFTLGLISSGRTIYNKTDDWLATKKKIQYANQQNMEAYLTQWELRYRKAGVPAKEARRLVHNAVLSGNLDLLKRKSRILRAQGNDIQDPNLVTETYQMDDYWSGIGESLWGAGKGIVTGLAYPIMAPYRTLKAYQEGGELAVATMDAYAKEQDASSRAALFQRLVGAGAPSRRVLRALNDYENNDTAPLRALFSEIRAKAEAERAAAEAEAEKARQEAAALADRLGKLLPRYNAYVTYLLSAPLKLNYTPQPAELKPDGQAVLIRFSLDDPQGYYAKVAKGLEKLLGEIAGSPAKVRLDYKFSCPGKPGKAPNVWYTNSPLAEGIYPVSGEIWVDVSGYGLSGPLMVLQRSFVREAFARVEVTGGADDYTKGIWPELRKTKRTIIRGYGGYFTAVGLVGAARSLSFEFKARGLPGRARIKMSANGKRIEELFVEYRLEKKMGYLAQKERLVFKNLKLERLDRETAVKPTKAYYDIDRKYPDGTRQLADLGGDGKWRWGEVRKQKWKPSYMSVFFEMDEQAQALKKKAGKEQRRKKKTAREDQKKQAQSGRKFIGSIGADEGYEGKIEISIGKDGQSVHGKFKSYKDGVIKGEKASSSIRGEFLGAIDPKTGQMTARLTEGGAGTSCFSKKYDRWYSYGGRQDWANKVKVIGQLKGDALTGYLALGSQESYAWTAKPVVPAKRKEK